MNIALTAAAVITGWLGVSAVVLATWAVLTRPARDARRQAAQDENDARRQAIADAMHRHPAGTALPQFCEDCALDPTPCTECCARTLRSFDDQIVDAFRDEIEAFEAARRASRRQQLKPEPEETSP